jgi:guanylate kinase
VKSAARIVVLSAPSGGGKTTIARAVREHYPDRFGFSVSATTRKPRGGERGERDGVDYHFWSRAQFQEAVHAGRFLEHAEYAGEHYGTLKAEVEKIVKSGRHVLLDIEVEGARQVREQYPPPQSVSIFILPSEPRVLLERLRARKSESEDEIARRLKRAKHELKQAKLFDRWIRNDDLDTAVQNVVRIADGAEDIGRRKEDIEWVGAYGPALQDEAKRFFDTSHQEKG